MTLGILSYLMITMFSLEISTPLKHVPLQLVVPGTLAFHLISSLYSRFDLQIFG